MRAVMEYKFKKQIPKFNLIGLALLFFMLSSCPLKTEHKQPQKYYNTPDHKYDDDEIIERPTKVMACNPEEGTYIAKVQSNNPKTDSAQTYPLEIEISDCKVTRINSPNEGNSDKSPIISTSIDAKGKYKVTSDSKKICEMEIEE